MNTKEVVINFWKAMQSNDFTKASKWLSENYECYWPQSNELIVGKDNFIAINSSYPANGTWLFDVQSIVCEGSNVVTDVLVTDGVQNDRVITFHTVENGLIVSQKEFWPGAMHAQEWRAKWVSIALE